MHAHMFKQHEGVCTQTSNYMNTYYRCNWDMHPHHADMHIYTCQQISTSKQSLGLVTDFILN